MNNKAHQFLLHFDLFPYCWKNGLHGTKSLLTSIAYLILLFGVFQPDIYATSSFGSTASRFTSSSLEQAFTDPVEPPEEAEYEAGYLYLKVADNFDTEIPTDILRAPAGLRRIIDQYQISAITQPFAALGTVKTKRIYKLKFAIEVEVEQLIKELESRRFVEYAERVPLKKFFDTVPNDPSVSNPDESYHLKLMRAYEAFDIQSGNGSVVAIVDSGVRTDHEDFSDNGGTSNLLIVNGCDVANHDDNPNPDDFTDGHGTQVAGIAGAATNNETGVASIGWGNRLMPIKIADRFGNLDAGYQGIIHAAMEGALIINCSWGSYSYSHAEYTCVKEVVDNYGVIIIAAAGNENWSSPGYPAAYGERASEQAIADGVEYDPNLVIAVASLDEESKRSSISNYGTSVDIAAYGSNVYSTSSEAIDAYKFSSGTSLAAPQVAGLVGLMMATGAGASREAIITCLLSSANTDIYDTEPVNSLGAGRVDAYEALACIASSCDFPYIAMTSSNLTICEEGEVDIQAGPASNYSWSTGDNTQSITVTAPGDYSVTATLVDGCTATNTISVLPALTQAFYDILEPDFYTGHDPDDNILCAPTDDFYFFDINIFGGGDYSWNNGSTSSTRSFANSPQLQTSTRNYSVTVTDVGGCAGVTDVLEFKITTMPAPPIPILYVEESSDIVNDAILCSPDSEAAISATPPSFNYEWNTGETTQAITVDAVETTDYTVTVSDENNCKSMGNTTVWVEEECDGCYPFEINIDIRINPTLTDPCILQAAGVYIGPPNNSEITWEWTVNEVPYSGQYIEFSRITGQVRYELTATSACGETATYRLIGNYSAGADVRDVTATPNPTICGRYDFLAEFTTSRPDFTLTWDFGDGTVINGASISESHFYEDDGDYTVIVTSEKSCSSNEVVVMVDCPDCATSNIGIEFSAQAECGDNIAFNFVDNDSPSQGIQAVLWDFGDGTTSTLFNPMHMFDNIGLYDVQLVIVNNCGGTTAVTQTIQIGSCIPNSEATPTPMADNCRTFTFTDNNDCDDFLRWEVDGVTVGTEPALLYEFPASGEYEVEAVFWSDNQCEDSFYTESFIVTVNCPCLTPDIAFTFADNGCGEFDFKAINNDPSQTIASWTWDFGFNEGEATGSNASQTYENSGLYTATLTAINDCGEESSTAQLVDADFVDAVAVNLVLVAEIGSICSEYKFAVQNDAGGSYNWYIFDENGSLNTTYSDHNSTLTHNFNANGSYSIAVQILNCAPTSTIISQDVTCNDCEESCEVGGRVSLASCPEQFPAILEDMMVNFNINELPVDEDGFYTTLTAGVTSYDISVNEESLPVLINYDGGVTTYDITRIIQHILETYQFTAGWEYVASDVNRDGIIDLADILAIRSAILGFTDQFSPTNPRSWACPATIELGPSDTYPEVTFTHSVASVESANLSNNFLAVELGNLNPLICEEKEDNFTSLNFSLTDQTLIAGESLLLPVSINGFNKRSILEFAINYDNQLLSLDAIKSGDLKMQKNDTYFDEKGQGKVRGIWFPASLGISNDPQRDPNQFYVRVTALKDIPKLSSAIKLDPEVGSNRIYSLEKTIKLDKKLSERETKKPGSGINWVYAPLNHAEHSVQDVAAAAGAKQGFIRLVSANPFTEALKFQLVPGHAQRINLALYSFTGQQVIQQQYPATSSIVLDQLSGLPSGIYFYQLTDDTGRKASGRVVKR